MVAIERCAELLISGEKSAEEVLEAVALLVGTLGGTYQMPVAAAVQDDVLRQMTIILAPAHVKVRRCAMVQPGNLSVGDGLRFDHLGPMVEVAT